MYKLTNTTSILRADGACIPAAEGNTDYAAYLLWLSEGNTPDPVDPPTTAQIMAEFTSAIQTRLDAFAATRGYDGILSACTYATSTVPKCTAEGQCAVNARDTTWAACYAMLAEVEAGTRPMPTLAEVIAAMPELVWPI